MIFSIHIRRIFKINSTNLMTHYITDLPINFLLFILDRWFILHVFNQWVLLENWVLIRKRIYFFKGLASTTWQPLWKKYSTISKKRGSLASGIPLSLSGIWWLWYLLSWNATGSTLAKDFSSLEAMAFLANVFKWNILLHTKASKLKDKKDLEQRSLFFKPSLKSNWENKINEEFIELRRNGREKIDRERKQNCGKFKFWSIQLIYLWLLITVSAMYISIFIQEANI